MRVKGQNIFFFAETQLWLLVSNIHVPYFFTKTPIHWFALYICTANYHHCSGFHLRTDTGFILLTAVKFFWRETCCNDCCSRRVGAFLYSTVERRLFGECIRIHRRVTDFHVAAKIVNKLLLNMSYWNSEFEKSRDTLFIHVPYKLLSYSWLLFYFSKAFKLLCCLSLWILIERSGWRRQLYGRMDWWRAIRLTELMWNPCL